MRLNLLADEKNLRGSKTQVSKRGVKRELWGTIS
jgi:hypothetical protein